MSVIKFVGSKESAVWTNGRLVGPEALVARAETLAHFGEPVSFQTFVESASLDDEWSAAVTVGAAWVDLYNEVPSVSGLTPKPGVPSEVVVE